MGEALIEDLLYRAWETARRSWPQLDVPADVFVRYLAKRLPTTTEVSELTRALDQLVLADLYLACACIHNLTWAVEILDRRYLAKLPAALASLKLTESTLDDVCQRVRIHLLLGSSEAGPRLTEYAGIGTLMSWIRAVAVRIALRLRASDKETPDENSLEKLEAMPAPEANAEVDLIKRRYRPEFQQALRESLAALPDEQRTLLRYHFIDGLTTTELGPLFGVNQSTISRRLKSARQTIYEDTKRRLQERLGLSSQDFTSLVALDSQLDAGISQILKTEDEQEDPSSTPEKTEEEDDPSSPPD